MKFIPYLIAVLALGLATPGLTQAPTPGELSRSNQDVDMRAGSQTMQTVGEHSDKPGLVPGAPAKAAPSRAPRPATSPPVHTPDPESKETNGTPPVSAAGSAPPR